MNERGFFTIVGLCLLLVAAIFIKGVHEFEANYSRGITNSQAEHELQNAADTGLAEALEKLKNIPPLEQGKPYNIFNTTATSDKFKNLKIEVWAQKQHIKKFIRTYSSGSSYTDNDAGEPPQDSTIMVSIASCDSPFIAGKMYRRAFAYILDDDPETEGIDESATIHFLNSL